MIRKIIDAAIALARRALKPENRTALLGVISTVLLFLFLRQCGVERDLRKDIAFERQKAAQNASAMTEQIKVIKDLNGSIEASKAAYLGGLDELRKYDSAFAAKLDKQKGLIVGIYADLSVKIDSIVSHGDTPQYYGDSVYGIEFLAEYVDSFLFNRVHGETRFKYTSGGPLPYGTTIKSNEMRLGITYGLREYNDRYECFALSKSDKITFNELDGVLTIPRDKVVLAKKLRWGIGVQTGIYVSQDFKLAPSLGVGLSYNFIRF